MVYSTISGGNFKANTAVLEIARYRGYFDFKTEAMLQYYYWGYISLQENQMDKVIHPRLTQTVQGAG